MTEFPNDADGDALRRVAATADLSRPMDVEFMVAVPDKAAGDAVCTLASERGYVASVEQDEETATWTCHCQRRMLLSYEAVIAAQAELDAIAHPVGGRSDGWGTFGNLQSDAD